MTTLSLHLFWNRVTKQIHRWFFGPPLNSLLTKLDDGVIDAELERLDLHRRDLFVVSPGGSVFLKEMTGMMSALGVDLDSIVEKRWDDLKRAEERCAYCATVRHCKNWLENWAGDPGACLSAMCFCPNAPLFAEFMDRQADAYDTIACRTSSHN